MHKTCKCGSDLNDVIVPNNVFYRAYFKNEWEDEERWMLGQKVDTVIRRVWHCCNCNRLYYWNPDDITLVTYCLESDSIDSIPNTECTCKEEFKHGELLPVYTYNDFELHDIWNQVREGNAPIFSRKVFYCPKCKRIYVVKPDKFMLFTVEDIVDRKKELRSKGVVC